MKKNILITCSFALLGMQTVSAQDVDEFGIFDHIGINLAAGSEGLSVGIAAPITNYVEIGAGVNFMLPFKPGFNVNINGGSINDVPRTNEKGEYLDKNGNVTVIPSEVAKRDFTLDKLHIKANLARTTFDVKLSVYPFGIRNDLFVAAGFSFGGKKLVSLEGHNSNVAALYEWSPAYDKEITAVVDQYHIKIDKKGNAEGDIRVKDFRPYLGLGYGRMVPKEAVGFRVEAGVQFMGNMKVYQNDTELPIDSALKSDDDISKIINNWKVYPVLKFIITTRFL